MISYEKIKKWFEDKENKNKVVLGVCFVLVFIVGFGTGRFEKEMRKSNQQNNYNTNLVGQTTAGEREADKMDENDDAQILGTITATATSSPTNCLIKGNVSSSGLIYHVPGGSFYDRTNPEMCFNTEAEAQAAGFRKSSR